MELVFTQAFGNFEPGDEIEVQDGDVFDVSYLKDKAAAPPEDPPAAPAAGAKDKTAPPAAPAAEATTEGK